MTLFVGEWMTSFLLLLQLQLGERKFGMIFGGKNVWGAVSCNWNIRLDQIHQALTNSVNYRKFSFKHLKWGWCVWFRSIWFINHPIIPSSNHLSMIQPIHHLRHLLHNQPSFPPRAPRRRSLLAPRPPKNPSPGCRSTGRGAGRWISSRAQDGKTKTPQITGV